MPTGVAIRDAREQLFDAAERVLLRDGPNALTSRAVTTEAGFAKGVLHRHFTDFDAFLTELVLDRIARIDGQAAALRSSAGTGTVAGNLTGALMALFRSVAVAIVALIISRDDLRARVRQARPAGVPLLAEATAMIASYLTAERELGRITADAPPGRDLHLGVAVSTAVTRSPCTSSTRSGLDYVSCSPFRVPVARLEAGSRRWLWVAPTAGKR